MTEFSPLWKFAEVNPSTPEFKRLPEGAKVPFMPLETVWPGGRADFSRAQSWTKKSSYTQFRRGDVLVPKITPTFEAGRSVIAAIPGAIGLASTEVHVVRPLKGVDPRFITYGFRSLPFLDKGAHSLQGVGNLRRVTPLFVQEHRVLDVDLNTQRAIADYLDRETGEIDAMIGKLDELEEALLVRRKTLILRGTCQDGLSVDSAADASETTPLPEGWRLLPLKFALKYAQTGIWGEEADGGDDDILCARVADFDRVKINVTEVPTVRRVAAKDREKCALRHGDILVEKSGGTNKNPVGTVVAYEGELPAVYANFILGLRPLKDHHARFWLYALHGSYLAGRTWNFVRQTTGIQNLDVNGYLSMSHPVPTHAEQRRIADHLDKVTGQIDAMLSKVAELKELLIERRAALITDVVTGRKKVA